jgi:hypothetical protein
VLTTRQQMEDAHIFWVERAASFRDRTSPFIILLDAPQSSLPPGMTCAGDDMVVCRQTIFFFHFSLIH